MPTIKGALADAAKQLQCSCSPLLDAEILLCKVLAKDRSYLRAWLDRELTDQQYDDFRGLISYREQGMPIAYLTGLREFWSRDFLVTPDVLIPRPDTELLIELSLALIPVDQPWQLLDLGTGSGIIAITLATERPLAEVIATDISPTALQIAKLNAERLKTLNIQFVESNWLANIPQTQFKLIVSNPPYLAENDEHLTQGDLRFEPKSALIATDQGLADIKVIAETARDWLLEGGVLLVEHGYKQKERVQNIFTSLGYHKVQTHNDLAGLPRVTSGQYQS